MDSTSAASSSKGGTVVSCDLIAFATVRATPAELAVLRHKPGVVPGAPLAPAFLKHSDEQTVAGLAAVLQAIERHGLGKEPFAHWGVLAAPHFMGRTIMTTSLRRYAAEGAWGVSPHLIPHRTLHSLSGTISQALKIQGPNFGVGGGPGSEAECLKAAAALLADVPGVWVVLTGWDRSAGLGPNDEPTSQSICGAIALALTAPRSGWNGRQVELLPACERHSAEPFKMEKLINALRDGTDGPARMVWALNSGGWLELRGESCSAPAHRNGHCRAASQTVSAAREI